jgi:very-short-patch-repair endonuclease
MARRRLGSRGSVQLPEVWWRCRTRSPSRRWRPASGSRCTSPGSCRRSCSTLWGPYRLDMAYPELMVAVEYDGRDHVDPDRALRDLHRATYLGRCGWIVLRFRAAVVL